MTAGRRGHPLRQTGHVGRSGAARVHEAGAVSWGLGNEVHAETHEE